MGYVEALRGFRAKCQENLERLHQAGMAVSVVQDDRCIFAEGFGYRDVDQKLKADADTIFPIGSASKAFTATAVMMLQDEGKVDIDKPLRDILPELVFQDAVANASVTARDIMCHRTGLPRHDFLWAMRPNIGRREIVETIRQLEPSAPFRSTWQYNNLMFTSAGWLVEKASGVRWEDFTKKRIFEPLGMKRANFNCEDSVIDGNFALAYHRDRQTNELDAVAYSRVTANGPAGSINASALELSNWLRFNLGKGTFDRQVLLKPETYAHLTHPNIAYALYPWDYPESRAMGYGLGWFVDCYRGKTLISHGGNVNGATAVIAFMPEINAGISVQVNVGGTALALVTMQDCFDRLLGCADAKDWAGELGAAMDKFRDGAEQQSKEKEGKRKPARTTRDLSDFCGTYRSEAYGTVKVLQQGDGLTVKIFEGKFPLENWHYDVFVARISMEMQELPIEVNFLTGLDGSIEAFEAELEGGIKAIRFTRANQ
jgi:CubicO group peptidase (beta-lactamase class C family)